MALSTPRAIPLTVPRGTDARSRLISAAASIASGLAIAFSMPPWGFWPLAFVGVAGLDRLLAGQPPKTRFLRAAAVAASWLFPSTLWMLDFSPPGWIIAGLAFAAMYGLGAAAIPEGRWRPIALPAMLVVVAAVRWRWPFGGVPLSTLAMSQADAPLAPTVRVLGPLLAVWLVGVVGVGLSSLVERRPRIAVGAAAIVGLAAVGAAVAPTGTAIGTLDVAIVQGGGPQRTRATDTDSREVFQRHLEASRLIQAPVDLVLWPENVVDVDGTFAGSDLEAELSQLARDLDAYLIPGIIEDGGPGEFLNFSVAIDPDGDVVSRYDKERRVPFGEYFPFRSFIEPLAGESLPSREAVAGTGPAILATDIGDFGIVISWEVFFEDRAREGIKDGGTVVLNPTNGSSYWLTIVQSQQIASSRLRALETGRYVLQAAPTGFSAIVEPDGDVIDRSGVSETKIIRGTIEQRTGQTWAIRYGPWPMVSIALASIFAAWVLARRDTRDGTVTPPTGA